jgi:hypothetical protein
VSRLPAFYWPPPASVFGCQGASTSIMSIIPCIIVLCQAFYNILLYALYCSMPCISRVSGFVVFSSKKVFLFYFFIPVQAFLLGIALINVIAIIVLYLAMITISVYAGYCY